LETLQQGHGVTWLQGLPRRLVADELRGLSDSGWGSCLLINMQLIVA
jgi:hypothetical protein